MPAYIYKNWGLKQLGWITLTALLIFFSLCPKCLIDPSFFIDNWETLPITLIYTYTLAYSCSYVNGRLDPYYSWLKEPLKKFLFHFTALGLFSFILSAIMFYIMALAFFGGGDWLTWEATIQQAKTPAYISLTISAIFTSADFLRNWKFEAIRAERLEKEKIATQYESLKNQVNPHFLFNSLNALSELVYADQELAVKYIRQLSEVYRYVLDSRNNEVATVHDELAFLDSYIFLQKIRFGENLKISMEVNRYETNYILPLSLQILIENAIKHNIVSTEEPLEIHISEETGYLMMSNRINRKKSTEKGTGIGLENISLRYKYLTEHPLIVDDSGSFFIVKIPLLTEQP
ncbi:MAG: histidine kinase [Cyclobacteriaceae bacterium]|nr:histidine kinase [Cyclobacteriaceae bacterium]